MNIYLLLLGASGIVLLSFIFNKLSTLSKVPTVLMLVGTGMLIQFLTNRYVENLNTNLFDSILRLLGTLGLIFIVLEGALDLKLNKEKSKLATKALLSATVVFCFTSVIVMGLFILYEDIAIKNALVYAIPLSIISSAIAIPTAANLTKSKRDFILYESTLSDIIGILIFDYLISVHINVIDISTRILSDLAITIPVTALFIVITLLFMKFTNSAIKSIPLLSIVVGAYALTKMFHLPALLLVFVFGIVIKNINVLPTKYKKMIDTEKLKDAIVDLKTFVIELAFLIRTFFFIVLGFSIPFEVFSNKKVWIIGLAVFVSIYAVRLLSLRYILKVGFRQELFIAPRGLVTVILFFSIPDKLKIADFNDGVVYFVIVASSLVMMAAFMFERKVLYVESEESTTTATD